jgi:heptosyltransferase-1
VRRELQRVRYHAVIDCQGLLKSALLAWSARGPATGFDRRSAREPLAAFFYDQRVAVDGNWHAVDRNRTVAAQGLDYSVEGREAFGIAGRLDRLAVPAPFDEQGAVLLLPNASRAGKLWPEASWVALEHQLARAGHLSWMAWGSEAEHARCQAMARRMHAARVLPRAGLTQLAALAARATAVIGVDTGLTHLAAACGAPTVGIYRDFDPGLVGLRGPGPVRSLGGVDANPGVDEVLAAVLAARADAAR